ncbi:MAG: Ig-like domain-containing protein [Fidelibacterota bacterium]
MNHSRVSYDLSEALAEATVTWRWVDGKADRQSPHVVSLSGSELDQGMHDGILLSGGPVLTDGATYNLYFEGEDFARNQSDTVTVVRVTYDTTSPVIDVVHPEPEAYISGPAVAYRLSEDLMEGEVVWSWSGGSSDPSAPHVQKMGEPERLAGDHEGELAAPVSLVDGGVYTVTVKGIDRAGNPSRPREIPGVTYDAYPPEIAVQTPAVGSHISRPGITYTLSEDFEWAEIVWIRTGGNADPLSPHRAELTDQQLAGGDHTEVVLALDSPLQDGTIYTVLATGGDRAGNPADTVRVEGVTYDTSAPLVALQAPSPGDFINATRVSYTLSEPLSKGQITWTHTAGPSDDGSPHLSLLSGTELDSGRHVDRLLAQAPPLVEGAVYTLTFSGVDRAGNPSKAVVVEGVTYDTQAPVITLNAPHDSSHRNHTRMSYTLSESLARGTVTWTRTAGTPDDGSPHEAALTDTALAEGSHVNVSPPPTLALADGAVYAVEIAGEDRAGNRSSSRKATGVVYDITPPTLVLTSPSAEMIINSPSLSYDLSETLKEAFFVWSHSGGRPDPGSPHRTFLTGGSLEAGSHADVVPAEAPELVSGSTYTLTFEGTDLAGNGARPLTVPAVTFDNKPPVMAVEKPASSGFANRPVVTYSLSEMLESLEVKWIRTGGSEDPGSPHLVRLEGRELEPGDHPDVAPVPVPPLVDGSVYRVVFTGADLAGNEAAEVAVSDVTFDAAPPVVALSTPGSGSAVNSAGLSYRLSEDLRQGSVTWERIGGRDDPRSPHVSRLTVEERAAGTHENRTLVETPPLVDGAVYRITLQGEDAAGNRADSVAVDSVVFDVSPPVIVANFPAPSSSVNSPVVSYRLSEDLREGTITWTRTGGETDPGSPHVLTLAPGELTAGDHQNLLPEPAPELVTGAVYSVSFDGQDRAGNRASGMVIESVTFDSEKPLIAVQTPGGTPYLNRPNLTYELSETLKEATVTWSWESGEADPGAPHVTPLTGQELAAGKHLDAPFTNGPRLQDGAVYTVTFTGTDPAGNEGEPVTLPGIAFDATPPVIRVTSPVPGQYLNSTAISYGLSEDLVVGTVTWTRTGGNEDTGSPHTISLSAEEMTAGDHPETVLTNQPPLVDGTTYTLTMTGQDPAGNAPEEITVVGLTFDSVPPEVVWHEPSGGSFVNDLFLTYALSESLAVGQITLSRTGGEADPSSPYEIDLTGEDLSAGRHDHTVPPGLPVPVSGAVYALTFQGSDLAGNEAEPAVVDGVTFDNTPPAFTVMAPGNSDYVNHTRLTYELSERLATGRVTWNPVDGESPQVKELTEGEREGGLHEDISLQDSPELVDGQAYDILFEGSDFAGNEAPPVTVTGVTYDVTSPKLKVELNSPIPHTFKKDTPVSITSSEEMSEIVFTWVGESGVNDPASPHRLPVPEEYLVEGRHDDIILPGIEGLQEGTSYTLTVTGKDLADNESRPQSVENIDIIRDLTGDWLWKGALLTAVWSFQEGGGFVQGVMMGTRISEKEQGQFRVDFTTRPYELMIHFETGVKRYALFEFTGSNSMRVVAGQKKPSSWSDGDLMNFEYREPEVP